jgi:hypothetical protein
MGHVVRLGVSGGTGPAAVVAFALGSDPRLEVAAAV